MADATIVNLFTQLFTSDWIKGKLTVVWHAGEPMVLPIAYYRNAFDLIEGLRPRDVTVVHDFQTNGTLFDDAWCEFIIERGLRIGLSIDGPRTLHDLNRTTRSGRGTFDKAIAGARLLRDYSIPFHVITVLTTESMAVPDKMFDFYVSEGIDKVGFNVEETEGSHASITLKLNDVEGAYYRFLAAFWRRAAAEPDKIKFIREIEQAVRRVLRPHEASFSNELVEPFAVMSVDWAGNVSTFSPELLGQRSTAYQNFVIGNVNRDKLCDIARSPELQKLSADIAAGVELCRQTCSYFSVCGGGEPANKLAENGSFISSETRYCRTVKMQPIDLVLDSLDSFGQGLGTSSGSTSMNSHG